MIRTTLVLWFAMACDGIGNIFFRRGMQSVGPLEQYRIGPLLRYFLKTIRSPHIFLGVLCSIVFFFLWLAVLSWADVSWALPMNAVEYVFVAVTAMIFLKE